MESDNENGVVDVDRTPGTLVWVRRRNGSWWPGRILGPEELPESFSNLTRSGTPIKLLGREDGSVDWYNFDKSRRVKAFRCGEYDECIEKAKEHALHTNRKVINVGKYVRREDAILHALELEARSSDVDVKSGSMNNIIPAKGSRSFVLHTKTTEKNKEPINLGKKHSKHKKSSQKLPQPGVAFEHPSKPTASDMQCLQKRRWRTPNDSEDDTIKGMKRMRDLQDLGVGMILKRAPNGHVRAKRSHNLSLPESASLSNSDFENDLSNTTPINSSRDSCSSLKWKRPLAGQAFECLKKKCRRRSLAEVGRGESKIKTSSPCHKSAISEESSLQGVTDIKARVDKFSSRKKDLLSANDDSPRYSGLSGTSSEEALLDENTGNVAKCGMHFHSRVKDDLFSNILGFSDNGLADGFIDVPVMAGGDAGDQPLDFKKLQPAKLDLRMEEDQSNHCIHVGLISPEGLGEACSTGSSTQVTDVRQKMDMGGSEWNTKGKRNARHISLNKHVDSESIIDRTDQSGTCSMKRTTLKETANSTSDESLTSDSSCQQIKCMSVSEIRDVSGDEKPKISLVNAGKRNLTIENDHHNPGEDVTASKLGTLEMQSGALASNTVCATSMAIHVSLPPRQIRVPSRYRDGEQESLHLYDVELTVQSNYQGQRVPLVSLRSKFNGKAIIGHPVTVEAITGSGRSTAGSSNKKSLKDKSKILTKPQGKGERGVAREKKVENPLNRCSWSNKKPSNVRKTGCSPRKIRRLSSFAVDHKSKEDRRKLVVHKIGGFGGPAVSCIPVRLVFSRLNEALNSSVRAAS